VKEAGAEIIPTLNFEDLGGGVLSRQTYEKFKSEIVQRALQAGKVDGVYMDIHGALVVEGYPDAQTDILRSIRAIVGPAAVISGSFDLHGNVSEDLAREFNIIMVYRTAPHVDQPETRLRAVNVLLRAIKQHQHPIAVLLKVPILVPGERAMTTAEPLKSIYAQLPSVAHEKGLLEASIFVGHAWADLPYSSKSAVVVADSEANRQLATQEARRFGALLWEHRAELKFSVPTAGVDEAIRTALSAPERAVFVSDSGADASARSPGDTTIVLERLRALGAKDAVVAGIVDPTAEEACEHAGLGKRIKLNLVSCI
jgi:microcystin degradation protein MlrC